MAADGLSIEMLPARHGDALWVEWGSKKDRHRMLIDGGPAATYKTLQERFGAMGPDDRLVDLMVVTHVDLDHIDGSIRLLRDQQLGVRFSDVWFNDYRHLSEARSRGGIQGEFLAAVLATSDHPWNRAFNGGPVVVHPTGSLPRVTLDGGLELVLLSPTPDKLLDLKSAWEKTLREAEMEPGNREEALERLEQRMGPVTRGGPPPVLAERTDFGRDGSEANGSSIAFIAEYRDERWLLAGDAHEDVLVAGLERYGREVRQSPVRLDGFKLPHHGSVRNISPALLDSIDCRKYLVSTSGAYFKHPDPACIDLIVSSSTKPELVFNYRSKFNQKWATPSSTYTSTFLEAVDETDT